MTLVGSLDAKAPVQAKYDIAAVYGNARAPPKVTLKVMPSTVPWESCWTTLHMSTLFNIFCLSKGESLLTQGGEAELHGTFALGKYIPHTPTIPGSPERPCHERLL
eukprot:1160873-Pelagomonas_calceolata.AAC.1